MAAVIALRPEDDHGRRILDELEEEIGLRKKQVIDDGTRCYQLDAGDAESDGVDSILYMLDPDWPNHVTVTTRRRWWHRIW